MKDSDGDQHERRDRHRRDAQQASRLFSRREVQLRPKAAAAGTSVDERDQIDVPVEATHSSLSLLMIIYIDADVLFIRQGFARLCRACRVYVLMTGMTVPLHHHERHGWMVYS